MTGLSSGARRAVGHHDARRVGGAEDQALLVEELGAAAAGVVGCSSRPIDTRWRGSAR